MLDIRPSFRSDGCTWRTPWFATTSWPRAGLAAACFSRWCGELEPCCWPPMPSNYRATSTAPRILRTPPAGSERILGGRSDAERKRLRQGISLRDSGITPQTRARYHRGLLSILPFIEHIAHLDELGAVVEEWVECQWELGTPLGYVGDALCALQFYWHDTKLRLRSAWKLYHNWRKIEVPVRAPPLSALIVRAFVEHLLNKDEITAAFLIALGFHCYLRTGELLGLRFRDLQISHNAGVVTIQAGKSGLRHNIDEAVAIYDPLVRELGRLVCLLPHNISQSSPIWPQSAAAFRKVFLDCTIFFQLQSLCYKPYSLRRGGATHDYLVKGILEPIILRGRWRSLGVARLYIEDGLAQYPSLRLTLPVQHKLQTFAQPWANLFSF